MPKIVIGKVVGETGAQGIGIKDIAFKTTDEQGNNVYTFTMTDNNVYEVVMPRGPQGEKGEAIEIDFSNYYTKTQVNEELAKKLGISDKAVSATSADKFSTARKINGVAFDGTKDITITAEANGGTATSAGSCTGNSATATKLQTARTINGVSFDGTANITVADNTKMPLSGNHTKSGNLTITGSCNANTVTATGNITAYSDRRTKAELKIISGSLEKLKTLTGYEYLMITSNEKSMGFLADEVEKVFPTAVIEDENGIQKVAYIQLIAPILEAIKELEERIRKLEEVI